MRPTRSYPSTAQGRACHFSTLPLRSPQLSFPLHIRLQPLLSSFFVNLHFRYSILIQPPVSRSFGTLSHFLSLFFQSTTVCNIFAAFESSGPSLPPESLPII